MQAGFLAEVARDWAHLVPRLLHQSEASRGTAVLVPPATPDTHY
jgi:hypothetical protein